MNQRIFISVMIVFLSNFTCGQSLSSNSLKTVVYNTWDSDEKQEKNNKCIEAGFNTIMEKEFIYNRNEYAAAFNIRKRDIIYHDCDWSWIVKENHFEESFDTLYLKLYNLTSISFFQGRYKWEEPTDDPNLEKYITLENQNNCTIAQLLSHCDSLYYPGAYTASYLWFASKNTPRIPLNSRFATFGDKHYFESVLKENKSELNAFINELIDKDFNKYKLAASYINKNIDSDFERIYVAYKYLTHILRYDYSYDNSHRNLFGAGKTFTEGKGICSEIANLTMYFINSTISDFSKLSADKKIDFNGQACTTVDGYNHSWNVVSIQHPNTGKLILFEIDVTWDLGKSDFDYFLFPPLSMPKHNYTKNSELLYSHFNLKS